MIKASKCHSCPQRHSKPLKCHLGRIGFVKLNSLFSEQKRDHVLKEGFFLGEWNGGSYIAVLQWLVGKASRKRC